MNITSIIFDLGGVLYDIDAQFTADAFEKLGVKDFKSLYTLKNQIDLIDELEKGQIGQEAFCKRIREITHITASDEAIVNAWNALLIGIPDENIDLVNKLSQKYRLFLLSNTNIMHLNQIEEEMKVKGVDKLENLFDKAFYSFKMNMRKPDLNIYETALKQAMLKPEETLFIDDNADNVEAAKKAGIHALLKDRNQSAIDFMNQSGLL